MKNKIQVVGALILAAAMDVAVAQSMHILDKPIKVSIAANTPLEDALIEWGNQTGVQVMMDSPTVAHEKTRTSISGTQPAQAVLTSLLRQTGLSYTVENSTVHVVQRVADSAETTAGVNPRRPKESPAGTENAAPDSRPAEVAEIIVTAQKRDERLQDVPVPVTVVSGESLVEQNQLRLQDYSAQTPGFSVAPIGFQSTQILSFRGINTGLAGNPSVGIVVDDVPFGSSTNLGGGVTVPDIDPGDLARVETLRGPQGTLYGASSLGGLIKFVTVDPSTDRVSGRMAAGTSTVYNGAHPGYSVRGSTNLPISATVAIRASAFAHEDPGYIDNPVLHVDGINEQRVAGGRLAALWRPSDTFSIKASALYQRTSGGSNDVDRVVTGYLGPPLAGFQQSYPQGVGGHIRSIQAYSLTISAKLNGLDLSSVTGYNVNAYRDSWDYSFLFGPLIEPIFGVSAAPFTDNNRTAKFSQELRLSSSVGARFEWLVGAFYTHEDSSYLSDVLAEDPTSGAIAGTAATVSYPTGFQEYALFGDLTYHFTDRFDIQLGSRVAHTQLAFTETEAGPVIGDVPLVIDRIEAQSTPVTYLVTPRFKISRDWMVYARFASGYRSGGTNGEALPDAAIPRQYDPDRTYNYELGVKGNLLEHRLSFDASAFYIDWKSVQLSVIAPASQQAYISNVGRARSDGIELSLMAEPLDRLSINAWATYNDAVLKDGFPLPTDDSPGTYGVAGSRLPYGSRVSGHLSVDDEYPLTGDLRGVLGATFSYVGNRVGEFTPGPPNPPARTSYPAYTQTDLRAGLRFKAWNFDVVATNVFNKRGVLGGGLASYPPYAFTLIQPRTIDLSAAMKF